MQFKVSYIHCPEKIHATHFASTEYKGKFVTGCANNFEDARADLFLQIKRLAAAVIETREPDIFEL